MKFTKTLTRISFILILLLVISCSKKDTVDNFNSKVDGETIFKELFFLEGKASYKLPSLSKAAEVVRSAIKENPDIQAQLKDMSNDLITNINKLNPTFFKTFEIEIKSHDYFRVKEILHKTGLIVHQAGVLSEKYGYMFRLGTKISSDSNLLNQVKEVNVLAPNGIQKISELLHKNSDKSNEMFACTPAAAFCVYYAIAVAQSAAVASYTAVGAVNLIGYFTMILKTKIWFWDVMPDNPDELIIDDLIIKEVADYF